MSKLKGVDGSWVSKGAMNAVIIDYFADIFKSSNAPSHSDFFDTILPRVSELQNESLLKPFVAEEVKEALFAMFPDKAPGPNGMNPGFYQHFWGVVGPEVIMFVLNCLNSGVFPEGLNDSNVVLIPKKKVSEYPADLRPIALSNVVYKIMAKMIANRMKPFMDTIVSESQSTFIPDRLITDNILIAAEVGHFLNRKQCGKVGWGALKLDMARAYDKMEWVFLKQMMKALGFAEQWVNLIMMCVTTVSYNILINGTVGGVVVPTRGLRQGDPLSPYLFIICAEGLSLILQQAQSLGVIHGCRVARGAPPVSHLFFADDSLLFFKANVQEVSAVKQCLEHYEKLSGQSINYHKSSICFSKNTGEDVREERTMNRYYWNKGGAGGIHWMAWDRLSKPKTAGGLGFKDLKAFNLAMLGNNPSYCWRSIMAAHGLVCGGIRRRIGNGEATMIGKDPWLLDLNYKIHTNLPPNIYESKVSGLMDHDTRSWDLDILNDIFDPQDVNRIRRVPVCPDYEDSWWKTFLWRALSGVLPTSTALANRRVDVNLACPMCLDFNEDVMHWLIECQYACHVWNESCLIITSVHGGSFVEWFQNAMTMLTMDVLIQVVAVLYHLWNARNSAIWEVCMWTPKRLWPCAKAALSAWRTSRPLAVTGQQHHHIAAPSGLQCHVDAAWNPATWSAAFGVVLLDDQGVFVAAMNGRLPLCENAITAEALACKEALSWLRDLQVLTVTLSTDCSVLQSYLSRVDSQPRSYVGIIVRECQVTMAQFITCHLRVIPRRLNVIAHTLASKVSDQDITMFWDDVPPDFIVTHLQ
ncbi:PREDICTED: uncharacterized protein LOC109167833 [Ipomoea nil]|uniref:uncharacterized protein LOC109167833 n=1 Tax=Ipomoea nil TaxID=35883 RepID=UPI000901AC70|nr:PREDICTED: uncharacterized protein LOC109167833 [Ipomoea nil]